MLSNEEKKKKNNKQKTKPNKKLTTTTTDTGSYLGKWLPPTWGMCDSIDETRKKRVTQSELAHERTHMKYYTPL